MSKFLAELYVSRNNCAAVAVGWARLNGAAADLTAEGRRVRLVRSIFVPDDETCFVLVEAATADDVRETARRAAVPYERVVEAAFDLEATEPQQIPSP